MNLYKINIKYNAMNLYSKLYILFVYNRKKNNHKSDIPINIQSILNGEQRRVLSLSAAAVRRPYGTSDMLARMRCIGFGHGLGPLVRLAAVCTPTQRLPRADRTQVQVSSVSLDFTTWLCFGPLTPPCKAVFRSVKNSKKSHIGHCSTL